MYKAYYTDFFGEIATMTMQHADCLVVNAPSPAQDQQGQTATMRHPANTAHSQVEK